MASSSSALPTPTSLSLEHELSPELLPTPNYKNMLIEFTQRANIAMPEYQSNNDGASHAPQFRSSVLADGLIFTVPNTFFHRKAAEQEVSKVALEYLVKKIKDEGRAIISKSVTFCKGLLYEYATKLKVKPPAYNTMGYIKVSPYFVCTMDFNCTSYIGDPARRKKDAEDLAARAAILSIIDNSESGIMLVQMIKTKSQLFNAVLSKNLLPTCDTLIVPPIEKTALSCELIPGLDDKDKGIAVPAGSDTINSIETVRTESGPVISTPQQPGMPNPEPAPEAAKSLNGSPAPEAAKSPNDSPAPEAAKSLNGSPAPEAAKSLNGSPAPEAAKSLNDSPAPEAAKSLNSSPAPEAAKSLNGSPAPEAAKSLNGSPAPEAAKSPNGSPAPEAAKSLNGSPAPEAAKSPNGSPAPEAAKSPNGSPAPEAAKSPNGSQQPDNVLSIDNAVSGRKRRRSKYKANKRARKEAQLKALPSGQVGPSMAQ